MRKVFQIERPPKSPQITESAFRQLTSEIDTFRLLLQTHDPEKAH